MMVYRLPIIALVAVVTAGLAYYYNQDDETLVDGGTFRHEYKLESFRLMHTDGNGAVSFRMRAPTLWKEPGQGQAMISEPKMDFFAASGGAWKADSARAKVSEDGTLVEMIGLTNLHRLASAKAAALNIETESLDVFPNQRLAESDGPVTIDRGATRITGVGLRIDLENEAYEVLSNVRIVESTL